jgi:hypothetical protein
LKPILLEKWKGISLVGIIPVGVKHTINFMRPPGTFGFIPSICDFTIWATLFVENEVKFLPYDDAIDKEANKSGS